jgi:hypothetical protein
MKMPELSGTVNGRNLEEVINRRQEWIERQRLAGDCALENGRCLTHNEPDTMAHHFSAHPGASTD